MDGDVGAQVAAFWDGQAARFDEEPDHGLLDEELRHAWAERLRSWLPAPPADVVDLGCGTGTLSVLLAGAGHRVVGVDLSIEMVARARAKADAAGVAASFHHGDAAAPPVPPRSADVVLVRHLLWTLPDPPQALADWSRLLRPGGVLVLIEGRWSAAGGSDGGDHEAELRRTLPWFGGVDAETLSAAVRPWTADVVVHDLSGEAVLWGRAVDDERFALVARTR